MKSRTLDEQTALLMQGTEYGDATLRQNMARELELRLRESQRAARPLRVYCGYDPTKPDLHLGHTITMRKLRQFQDLGHEVTFLIGDYTSLVGDPSDKDKTRPRLSPEEIRANAETYSEQAFRILDRQRTRIRYNSEWLSRLTFAQLIELASNFTIQQFMARERFALRIEQGEPVYLHEALYGLMQGYDAAALETDVQVGGSEQLFNIIVAGRKLQETLGQRPQVGILMGILPGTDGVLRMSKTAGNTIDLLAPADDMYGKVMSIPDAAMGTYARLVTRWDPAAIERLEADLAQGRLHPRDAKMRLAREITEIYWGRDAAAKAEDEFRRVFQEGRERTDLEEASLPTPSSATDALVHLGWAGSRSEARRKVDEGAVWLGEVQVTSSDAPLELDPVEFVTLRLGKKKQIRVRSRPPD